MTRHLPPMRALRAALGLILLALLIACDSDTATPTPIALSPTPAATAPAATDTAAPATSTAAPASPTLAPSDTPAPAAPATTEAARPPTETALPPTEIPAEDTATLPPTRVPATARPAARTATPRPPTRVPTATAAAPPPATDTAVAAETPANTPVAQVPTPVVPAGRVPGDMSQVERVPAGKHRIAITFDAGAGTGYVPSILTTLARHNTHITFFLTGQWAEQNPDQVRAIAAAGHEIANHTYSHPSFPKLSDSEMATELNKCEAIIEATTGVTTKPYWRPPFGDETGHVLNVAKALGYRSIYWTWDSLDSVGKPKSKDFLVTRVTEASIQLDGAIILMHVGNQTSADALPEIMDRLEARGLRVVTISELLSP